ncbi:MAG TPA: divergent polysaccharide deacetylase family protein [Candidatus Binatia bacterium]|nr:divergent polysaccharide deacetylase family protein [Candidatus Binatia bacterium]
MPRRLLLVALVAFAIGAAWWLLRPLPHLRVATVQRPPTPHPAATIARSLATPAPSPAQTPTSHATVPPTALPTGSPNPHAPRLALIVDDCGQWIDTERGFIALDIPITLSVLPDVPYTGEIAREAGDAGKGVMLHLPMETLSGLNPGPGKVTTEMTDAQIVSQVEADLAQVPFARGVNNHEGSKASADPRVMKAVLGVLAQRGDLFFVDSRTSSASVGEETARSLGVPTASRDVFIDNRAEVAYTEAQLLDAAAIAKRTGSAIAIGHPRPTTLEAVRALVPRLEAEGIDFVLAQDIATNAR